ncbi:hypothetical protein [Cognatiluteimonas profundi]|uniref:hypothetical protein n=1 Tax=Cognatiluteimonas profundi TaxID=2594501 RepID=UPI00131E8EAB|nr:hypothetical protein [Lysobacter profundi]
MSLLAMMCCGMAACATTGKYKDSLDAWKGRSDVDLIKSWGTPAEVFDSNGHRFLVYTSSRVEQFAPLPNKTGSHADYSKAWFCTTVFDTSGAHVVSWAIKGNDCTSASRTAGASGTL